MGKIRGVYALCDNSLNSEITHIELAQRLIRGGVSILQLRMKGETNLDKVRSTALAILELKKHRDFLFILNDFAELAAELPVDGLHIGQDDLSLIEARKLLGPGRLIGYSSHSLEEAMSAEKAGADYVALGAIFPTATKGPGHPVQGLETLRKVVTKIKVPIVAIGGIGRKNFASVLETGAAAAAMIGALSLAPDIEAEARWFVEEFQKLRG